MRYLSRRSLLKTGIAASAGLFGGESALSLPAVRATTPAAAGSLVAQIGEAPSPGQRLLLDFGWRFHLGNADDASGDFRYGAPMREGTFSKAGQDWLHNPTDDSLQHSFDDSAWRVVDLPHDWAVELPYIRVDGPGSQFLRRMGEKLWAEIILKPVSDGISGPSTSPPPTRACASRSSSTAYFATR